MIELYHFGDAICAFKIRTVLAEKDLKWTSRLIFGGMLRDPDYMKLNPKGVIPTIIDDGKIIVESRIMSEYLDEAYPEPPLMPSDTYGRYASRLWSKQVDDTLHLNIFVLSFIALDGWGIAYLSEEERQHRLPKDQLKRSLVLDLLADGIKSQWVPVAIDRFREMVTEMEASLLQHEWLAGDTFSLADIDIGAYITRLRQMSLEVLWQDKPAVTAWYERFRTRPSFDKAITEWLADEDTARYDINSAAVRTAALERIEQAAASVARPAEKRQHIRASGRGAERA